MKLTNAQIHSCFVGLASLDSQLEKCAPDTRFKIGINLETLRKIAGVFERTQRRCFSDITTASMKNTEKKETDAERVAREAKVNTEVDDAIDVLRSQEFDIEVMTILRSELRMAENTKITGTTIGQILPILEGIEIVKKKDGGVK